jgi:hypothetical protein
MTWTLALTTLDADDLVEFAIHQMDSRTGAPKWRRHKGPVNFRFRSVRAALFSPDKGARAACLGRSSYAKTYATGTYAIVPYVAAWLRGSSLAFLAKASAADPEVTVVPASGVAAVQDCPHSELLAQLAGLFATGAELHGVRLLGPASIYNP